MASQRRIGGRGHGRNRLRGEISVLPIWFVQSYRFAHFRLSSIHIKMGHLVNKFFTDWVFVPYREIQALGFPYSPCKLGLYKNGMLVVVFKYSIVDLLINRSGYFPVPLNCEDLILAYWTKELFYRAIPSIYPPLPLYLAPIKD